jgi:hypothetical protein
MGYRSLYEYESDFEEFMDSALNDLSPSEFNKFLDSISMILADYEDRDDGC